MRHWLNVGHVQFDLWLAGSAQQIVGKMLHADDNGCIIEKESDGTQHGYMWGVVQHATLAP